MKKRIFKQYLDAFFLLLGIIIALIFVAIVVHAQTDINGPPPGATATFIVHGPTPIPTPVPTPSNCDFSITSPVTGSTVSSPIQVTIQVQGNPVSGRWMNYYAGNYQTSGSVASGAVSLPGPFINDWVAVTAVEKGTGVPSSCTQTVLVMVGPAPTPTPVSGEIRQENTVANNTSVTPAQLAGIVAAVQNHTDNFNGVDGVPGKPPYGLFALPYAKKLDGSHKGTTTDIATFYTNKWNLGDPNITLAEMMQETGMYQQKKPDGTYVLGDICHGSSDSVIQIKSTDSSSTCPTLAALDSSCDMSQLIPALTSSQCLAYQSTALALDYQLAYRKMCQDGMAAAYFADGRDFANTTGHHPYPVAVANGPSDPDLVWGCIGSWFSGGWEDGAPGTPGRFDGTGSLGYQMDVQNYYVAKPWLQPGF